MLRGYSKRKGSSSGCHYWAGQLPYSSMQHLTPPVGTCVISLLLVVGSALTGCDWSLSVIHDMVVDLCAGR
jgi:hypothetical protein